MPHSFVVQPMASGYDLQEFVEDACADAELKRLDVAVAWIKRDGIEGLRPALEAFRGRDGVVRMVVGISLGGTSRQGLLAARQLSDELYVFHDARRTFHPKVYLVSGDRQARTFVGSHNLTYGGLSWNYEAAVVSDLALDDPADLAFVDSVRGFIGGLVADRSVCREATDEFLAELLANARYPILDEDAVPAPADEPVEGGRAGGNRGRGDALFGEPEQEMRPRRPIARRSPRRRPGPPPRGGIGAAAGAGVDPVVKLWFKVIKRADAQQLGGNSSPSNTMTLVDGGHPINRNTYFRYVFFASERWTAAMTRGGQPREVAMIEAEVLVDGTSLGMKELEVRHTPGYASDQGNRVSELGWRAFGGFLQANSMVDRTVVLEKLQSGRYRIRFDRVVTDPFLA
jgi:hypothetical protein